MRIRELADNAHLSTRTIGDVEHARRSRYSESTLERLESALSWEPGSAEAVLHGGDPTPSGQAERRIPPRLVELADLYHELDNDDRKALDDALMVVHRYALMMAMGAQRERETNPGTPQG